MRFTVTTVAAPVTRNAVSAALALSFALSSVPAVLAAEGVYTSIDYPGAILTVGRGISPEGVIVGWYRATDHSAHGYILQNGVFSAINFPGASATTTDGGPNPNGDVVGNYVDGNGVPHGYRLSGGVFTTIDFPALRLLKPPAILTPAGILWVGTLIQPAIRTDLS